MKNLLPGIVSVFILIACHRQPMPTRDESRRFQTASQLLDAIAKTRPANLQVTGMVEYRHGSERIKVRILYVAKQPATLRFETESFFDQPLSILVTDGMTFSSWDIKKGRFITGHATMANITKVLPVPMDGADIARMLLGLPPLIAYASAKLDFKQGQYIITLSNDRQIETIRVESESLAPVGVTLHTNGNLTYNLALSSWLKQKNRLLVPGKIRFEMPHENIKVRIKLFDANCAISPKNELFQLEIPDGVIVENWN